MSSEDSFSSLGKIEAINNLLSSAGLKRESSFSPTNGSLVKSAGRIFLEGIDFDLIYFPLPPSWIIKTYRSYSKGSWRLRKSSATRRWTWI